MLESLQVELDLLAIFDALTPRLEFEDGERVRRRLDETIDGSTHDTSIDRHRERNFMQRATSLI